MADFDPPAASDAAPPANAGASSAAPLGAAAAAPAPVTNQAVIEAAQVAAVAAVQQWMATAGGAAQPPPRDAPSPSGSQSTAAYHAMSRAQSAMRNMPTFNGKRDYLVVTAWLFKCEQAFELREEEFNIKLGDKFKILSGSAELVDAAATWWFTITQAGRKPSTWDGFRELVRNEFIPADYIRRAREKLNRCRQTGSVEAYINLFRQRALAVPGLTEGEKWNAFVLGLKPALEMRVREEDIMTFEKAARTALRYEYAWASAGITPEQAIGAGLPARRTSNYARGADKMEISNMSAGGGGGGGNNRGRDGGSGSDNRGNGGRENGGRGRRGRRNRFGLSEAEAQARVDRNACFVCNREGCRPHHSDCTGAPDDDDRAAVAHMHADVVAADAPSAADSENE